ncbi:MAG: sn-glycerol-3-phosphate import ATP-binding protein UgpC [Rhodospirillales bacterium]|nr:sn-glycerol-3-phosphate import ATP-binding protein UgpC [Rhodospirillales bacterium]
MAQVHLRGVKKTYDNKIEVIHGIDMEIADGEFIVIVGPSGCGKSTLLRMVAGLERITGGEVAIGDRVVNNLEPKDRDIAMVFQNYALYPHMSVYQNMAYGLKIKGMAKDEIERRVQKAAKILELGTFLQRLPRQLSGGQRQRVAMGRAIVREPAVFLFDEPLSNLDAKLRVQMRLEIKRLQRELGVTSIYVTHDQVEAMTLADRLIVMNSGVADQIGTPMDVYDRPASVFVAGFIGSPAMNFLAAKVGQDRKSVDLAGTDAGSAISMPLARSTSAPAGTAVALGVRPEHLNPTSDGPLQFEVELAEPLGADTLLHGRFGAARELVTVRQGGHVIARPGELRRFKAEPGHLHLFDSQTGKRFADT